MVTGANAWPLEWLPAHVHSAPHMHVCYCVVNCSHESGLRLRSQWFRTGVRQPPQRQWTSTSGHCSCKSTRPRVCTMLVSHGAGRRRLQDGGFNSLLYE